MHQRILGVSLALIMAISSFPVFARENSEEIIEPMAAYSLAEGEEVVASVEFGSNVKEVNMTATMAKLPDITVSNKLGREAWALNQKSGDNSSHIDFKISDEIMKANQPGQSYRVEVDYYDEEEASLVLSLATDYEYLNPKNHVGGPYTRQVRELEFVQFKNSMEWKTYSWFLETPAMDHRMDHGADFRISATSPYMGPAFGDKPIAVGAVRLIKTNTRSLVDIKVTNEKNTGHIFFTAEEIELDVSFDTKRQKEDNKAVGNYPAELKYTIYDNENNLVKTIDDAIDIEYNKIRTKQIKFDVEKYGLYKMLVELRNEEKGIYSREWTVFSKAVNSSDTPNPWLGINVTSGLYDNPNMVSQIDALAKVGFSDVRHHATLWGEVHDSTANEGREVTEATWYRQTTAEAVKLLREKGLGAMVFSPHNAKRSGHFYWETDKTIGFPITTVGYEKYLDMTDRIISLYGDALDEYNLWNEWNGTLDYSPEVTGNIIINARDYDKFCRYVYPRLKEKYPDMIFPGMVVSQVSTGGRDHEWLKEAFRLGTYDFMDSIDIHNYVWYTSAVYGNHWEQVQNTIDLMEQYHVDKPLVVTESGYSSASFANEDRQGWYDVQSMLILQQKNKVQKMHSFVWNDSMSTKARTDREGNFGYVEGGESFNVDQKPDNGEVTGSAKMKLIGVANFNKRMYDAEWVKSFDYSEDTMGFQFKKKSGTDLLCLFTGLEQDFVTMDLGTNDVTMYDFAGNESKLHSDNGIYSFSVGEAVKYIEGNFTKCAEVKRDKSQVYIDSAIKQFGTGETVNLNIVNNTGKVLSATVTVDDNSSLVPQKISTVPLGSSTISVNTKPGASGEYQTIYVKLADGDKIYCDSQVKAQTIQKITMSSASMLGEDKNWIIKTNISSRYGQPTVGTLEVVAPTDFAETVEPVRVELPAFGSATVDIDVPEEFTRYELEADMKFVPDMEGAALVYTQERFNFWTMHYQTEPITIDGDISDWGDKGWISLDRTGDYTQQIGYFKQYGGLADISAKINFRYDDENFYAAYDVTDDVHYATDVEPMNIWQVDGVQTAVVLYPEDLSAINYIEEFTVALVDGKTEHYRHNTQFQIDNKQIVKNLEVKAVRDEANKKTYYEIKVPWVDLIPNFRGITPGGYIHLGAVINDNDEGDRKGTLDFNDGPDAMVNRKNWTLFKKVLIGEKE